MDASEHLAQVLSASRQIEVAEQSIRDARRELVRQVIRLSCIKDKRERLSCVRDLYWDSDVPANALAVALFFDDCEPTEELLNDIAGKSKRLGRSFRRMVGPKYSLPCKTEGCAGRYYIWSRTELLSLTKRRNPSPESCEDCENQQRAEQAERYEEYRLTATVRETQRLQLRFKEEAELASLESKLKLSDDEKARFYELMSKRIMEEKYGMIYDDERTA